MKVVYIAGPFRASTAFEVAENVREAERWGLRVACYGAMPLIPHANTHLFHGQLDEQFWIDGTLELLKRSDALFLVPAWESSTGAREERRWMLDEGRPVFGAAELADGSFARWVRSA